MAQLRAMTAIAILIVSAQLLSAQEPDASAARSGSESATASASPLPAYRSNPKFVKAMHEGQMYLQHSESGFAKDEFHKADKIAGGTCIDCELGIYHAEMAERDFKHAIETAGRIEALARTPTEKAIAKYERATALYEKAGKKPKPEQLQAVHELLQQALSIDPQAAAALYLDGKVLTRMGRMDEAKASFRKCASCARPTDPARLRAQHFAEDPSLSLKQMAPSFVVTALDGSRFNLDAMGGRIVLIDFWATWCGPCNEELPEMKKIAKEFAGEPLVILSVSWDNDDAAWRAFIRKNQMTWTQYRDADHRLTREFGVEAIPHYFTIDTDGTLTSEMVGSGSNVEGRLRKLIAKAREAQKEQLTANQAAGGS